MQHHLNIFFNTTKVGILFYDSQSNEFNLKYDERWIQNGFAISNILGFDDNFKSIDIKNFIENLLPEGDGLDRVVNYLQISKNNKFALLNAIGEETSGAFSFIKEDEVDSSKTSFRKISNEELTQRIQQRKEMPITIWDEKPRLSVAGVQEKLPICKLEGKYGLASGQLCSTHILKFDKAGENLVLNEYFSLKLAKIAGLNIANAEIKKFGDELVLEVERFDRKIVSNRNIEKIHIIDSCQALSLPTSFKYERNFGNGRDVKDIREGVSFQKLDSLSNKVKIPILAKKTLLEWTIVNLILGNSDAHGKNISYFVDKSGLKITPFYDIVNISLYEDRYDTSLAMAIDDEFIVSALSAYDIATHCQNLNLTPKTFYDSFKIIVKKIENKLLSNEIEEISKYDPTFAKKYTKNILARTEILKKIVKESLDINPK
ncbi:MAG: HipA domain-containing protein [Arcobacteraceae bacterium]